MPVCREALVFALRRHLCRPGTGTAVSSVGFVACSPFLPKKVLLPQEKQGGHGGRHGRRSSGRSPLRGDLRPGPTAMKLPVDPWRRSSARSHTCLDRDGKNTLFHASVWKGQNSSTQPKEGTWALG